MERDDLGRALRTPVRSYADVVALDSDDRRRIAAWLSVVNQPAALLPGARRRRRNVLLIATGAALVLTPWVVILGSTLSDRHRAYEWRLAWVGFDIALVVAFAATAWFGWRTRQLVITMLLLTATLLLCDAWFDVTLSWGGQGQLTSIIGAVVLELPLAVFFLAIYHRLLCALTAQVWQERGLPGTPPPLRDVPLLLRPESSSSLPLR